MTKANQSDEDFGDKPEVETQITGDQFPGATEAKTWDDVTAEIKRASEAAKKAAETFLAAAKQNADENISPEARAALMAGAVGVMRGFEKALKDEAGRINELRLKQEHQENEAPKVDDEDDA